MNEAAFEKAVTAVLDAVTAAAVAETLSADISRALARAGHQPPPDLLALVRRSLDATLEPGRNREHDRAQLADLVNLTPEPPPVSGHGI
jgi:hypothetical protein